MTARLAVVVALVLLAATGPMATARLPLHTLSSEMALQPCFSGEGRCTSPAVRTSDGTIHIQIVPAFIGEVQVYLEGEGAPKFLYTCESPTASVTCSKIVDTKRAGTYQIAVVFGPQTNGGLLLQVVTPS